MKALYDKAIELGGQVSGSTDRAFKNPVSKKSIGDTAMSLMQGIKKVFDQKVS